VGKRRVLGAQCRGTFAPHGGDGVVELRAGQEIERLGNGRVSGDDRRSRDAVGQGADGEKRRRACARAGRRQLRVDVLEQQSRGIAVGG
jgi:hypothetical protein